MPSHGNKIAKSGLRKSRTYKQCDVYDRIIRYRRRYIFFTTHIPTFSFHFDLFLYLRPYPRVIYYVVGIWVYTGRSRALGLISTPARAVYMRIVTVATTSHQVYAAPGSLLHAFPCHGQS